MLLRSRWVNVDRRRFAAFAIPTSGELRSFQPWQVAAAWANLSFFSIFAVYFVA